MKQSTFLYRLSVLLFLILFSTNTFSQTLQVKGKVIDAKDKEALLGATVTLKQTSDTSIVLGNVTDFDGHFTVEQVPAGKYNLTINFLGYDNYSKAIEVNENVDLGIINLSVTSSTLSNVTITGEAVKATQSGDTTAFNANAYKTNPDASAEDLIRKMPGITKENGVIKAQGEEVKKVFVDGKPFFGDDPNATLQNLPAEIVDKIQLYDNLSDQAQLTGFDDGSGVKAINIVTKKGKNNGWFGRIYGGLGTEDFKFTRNLYTTGGNLNYFNGDMRLSILGLSNNVNVQNFSSDDLGGVMGNSGGRGGSRGGGAGNFMVGQQGGITQTTSGGINYSDVWAKKLKVSGSYFYNRTDNQQTNNTNRSYFNTNDSALTYKESSTRNSINTNNRANLRLEYSIDSSNTIIYSGRVSTQNNESKRVTLGNNILSDAVPLSNINNTNIANNDGVSINNNLTYRHRFAKRGRTFSLNLNHSINNTDGDGSVYSLNDYGINNRTILDQQYDLKRKNASYGASLNYTEPLTEKSQLMLSYAPNISVRSSEKITRNNDGQGAYTDMDTLLSNKYDNDYTTHRGGVSYRVNNQKLSYSAGLDYQYAQLMGEQIFPYAYSVHKVFSNVLPNAMMNIKFSKSENIRISYRTQTNVPSIQQLQNVIDNSNVLQLSTGNPDLKQSYQHNLMMRYGNTNTKKSTNFFAMLFANYTNNYISNATFIAARDTLLNQSVLLYRGSQLSQPVNLDGYFSLRSFANYGFGIKPIKSNLNINAGIGYNRTPGLINNVENIAKNYSVNGGFVLSSNISENVDFTLTHNSAYNVVKNSMMTQSNNNYYSQTSSLATNVITFGRLVWNTSVNYTSYSGLSQGFNESYVLWNAGVGYKFLKDKSLDVRFTANDILNQNRAISRNVTETYIEDSYTNVLQRYFMLNLTYTLRKFGLGGDKNNQGDDDRMRPANMPRHGVGEGRPPMMPPSGH